MNLVRVPHPKIRTAAGQCCLYALPEQDSVVSGERAAASGCGDCWHEPERVHHCAHCPCSQQPGCLISPLIG